MQTAELARQIISMYERHGWNLRRVLLRPDAKTDVSSEAESLFRQAELRDSDIDALWFARKSHANREAWELRLISEQPYALFEAFEADEAEEDREEARREMENRMREQTGRV